MASPKTIALREQQHEMRSKIGKLVGLAPKMGSRQVRREEAKQNRSASYKRVEVNRRSG